MTQDAPPDPPTAATRGLGAVLRVPGLPDAALPALLRYSAADPFASAWSCCSTATATARRASSGCSPARCSPTGSLAPDRRGRRAGPGRGPRSSLELAGSADRRCCRSRAWSSSSPTATRSCRPAPSRRRRPPRRGARPPARVIRRMLVTLRVASVLFAVTARRSRGRPPTPRGARPARARGVVDLTGSPERPGAGGRRSRSQPSSTLGVGLLVCDARLRRPVLRRRGRAPAGRAAPSTCATTATRPPSRSCARTARPGRSRTGPCRRAVLTGRITAADVLGLRTRSGTRWMRVSGPAAARRRRPAAVRRAVHLHRRHRRRRRSGRSCAESERRFRLLAEQSTDVIIRRAPRRALPVLLAVRARRPRLAPEEVARRSTRSSVVHPDDRPAARRLVRRLLPTGEPQSLRHRALHRDGRVLWVETAGRAVPGAGRGRRGADLQPRRHRAGSRPSAGSPGSPSPTRSPAWPTAPPCCSGSRTSSRSGPRRAAVPRPRPLQGRQRLPRATAPATSCCAPSPAGSTTSAAPDGAGRPARRRRVRRRRAATSAEHGALDLADVVHAACSPTPLTVSGHELVVTASIGVVVGGGAGDRPRPRSCCATPTSRCTGRSRAAGPRRWCGTSGFGLGGRRPPRDRARPAGRARARRARRPLPAAGRAGDRPDRRRRGAGALAAPAARAARRPSSFLSRRRRQRPGRRPRRPGARRGRRRRSRAWRALPGCAT